MVDAVERLISGERETFRRGEPDHQRPGQARAGGDSNGVDVVKLHSGSAQCSAQGGRERFQVGPGGDLWDDPAEADVLLYRGGNFVGQQVRAAHNADARLVAGGLDAQHQRLLSHGHPFYCVAEQSRARGA